MLVGKAHTTPRQYPLTLNAPVDGTNQRSNRPPLMLPSARPMRLDSARPMRVDLQDMQVFTDLLELDRGRV